MVWSGVDLKVHRFDSWDGIVVLYETNNYRGLSRMSPTFREEPPLTCVKIGGFPGPRALAQMNVPVRFLLLRNFNFDIIYIFFFQT